ncbi:hypothetical protein ACMDCT_00510 [Halomonadaceae bacterium KBTZ08]
MVGGLSGNTPLPPAPDPARRPDQQARQLPQDDAVANARDASRQSTAEASPRRAEAPGEPEVVRPRRTLETNHLPLRNQEALSAYDRIDSSTAGDEVELVGVDVRI